MVVNETAVSVKHTVRTKSTLLSLVEDTPSFRALRDSLEQSKQVCVEGVSGSGKALLCATLLDNPQASALVLTFNDERVNQLSHDLGALLSDHDRRQQRVCIYPSIASALYDGITPDRQAVADRLTVLERLCTGVPTVVVTTIHAAVTMTIPGADLVAARQEVAIGATVDRDALGRALLNLGYQRVDLVDEVGQFSIRGDIIDVSPPTSPQPVRIELFGDEVETIRRFDPLSQRSLVTVERVGIGPAGEILLTEEAVHRAYPVIKSAFRRELDRLNEEGKHREAGHLKQRMERDLQALKDLQPLPGLVHYLPFIYPRPESLCAYFPAEAPFIIDEPVRISSGAQQFEDDVHDAYRRGIRLGNHLRLPETAIMPFSRMTTEHLSSGRPLVYLTMLQRQVPWAPNAPMVRFSTPPVDSFGGRFELLAEGLAEWQGEGQHLLVCSSDVDGTVEVLQSRKLNRVEATGDELELVPGQITVAPLELDTGFRLPEAQAVVLTAREIFGWRKLRKPDAPTYPRGFSLLSLRELEEGDHVVHINHGIAIYKGLAKQTVQGVERDYLVLEYANNDRLYVPVTQLDRVQKYIGAESADPTITSLKSGRWEMAKRKARRSTALLARELMRLYALREQAGGHAFAADAPWLKELEASFRYEETDDQLRAIEDVKRDMEKPTPADRLICGDVGFGKTEVAIRAAFKAVLGGKQVAVLVPTTVLAQQHFNTFRERLSRYPVEVAMLSRFKSAAEQRRIVNRLKSGAVDIVIGTHRLLAGDVGFNDLGLLVIDEEQRFGVRQKERLKKFREGVDVLTLTATPIPRTLNMALSGLREISVINDPPQGRMPIQTNVREEDDGLIAEVIRRELARGGQVYFVHNRVHSIQHIAARVQRLVPDARVAIAHGQMDETDLERVMLAFYAEEFDVLVCTTIIENGLDVPNVNTIIISDADRLGLSQLYQLRGRVGRSSRQAYAYLLYRYPERMTQTAEERLKAIEEFSTLGSGFKIALRDLEIRGAGDILGAEQSGQMSAVGLDLYCQMLEEAVKTLKGERRYGIEGLPTIDLPVEAIIPGDYVPGENQRIALYRRLAAADAVDQLEELLKEIRDRYGPLPEPVENLGRIARLKLQCLQVGVGDIAFSGGSIKLTLADEAQLTSREQRMLRGLYTPTARQAQRGIRAAIPRLSVGSHEIGFAYARSEPGQLFTMLGELLQRLQDRENRNKNSARTKETGTRSRAVRK